MTFHVPVGENWLAIRIVGVRAFMHVVNPGALAFLYYFLGFLLTCSHEDERDAFLHVPEIKIRE